MHLGRGGPDKPAARGSQEEAGPGGHEVGGAGEGGEECAVDSLPPGTCLAKERLMFKQEQIFSKIHFFM